MQRGRCFGNTMKLLTLSPPGRHFLSRVPSTRQTLPGIRPRNSRDGTPPLRHVVSLASIGRDIFVPATWANRFQQPIVPLPTDVDAKRLQGDGPFFVPTADSLAKVVAQIRSLPVPGVPAHKFLLLLQPVALVGEIPSSLSLVTRGDSFALFRID